MYLLSFLTMASLFAIELVTLCFCVLFVSGGSRNRWWRGMWSKSGDRRLRGGWEGYPLPTEKGSGEGAVPPPHNFFQFWTSKWPVSVHCGCRWGGCIPLILPLDPPLDPCNIYRDGPRDVGYPADARSVGDSHPSCSSTVGYHLE